MNVYFTGKWATDPSFRVDYPKPHPTDMYHRGGRPVTETKRGRGSYGLQGEPWKYSRTEWLHYGGAVHCNMRDRLRCLWGAVSFDSRFRSNIEFTC